MWSRLLTKPEDHTSRCTHLFGRILSHRIDRQGAKRTHRIRIKKGQAKWPALFVSAYVHPVVIPNLPAAGRREAQGPASSYQLLSSVVIGFLHGGVERVPLSDQKPQNRENDRQ